MKRRFGCSISGQSILVLFLFSWTDSLSAAQQRQNQAPWERVTQMVTNGDPHARSEPADTPDLWKEGELRVFGHVQDSGVHLGVYQSIHLPYGEWKHLKLGDFIEISVQKVDA